MLAVEGERIFLDLTERDGVRPGQEFTIFRKGDVFRHPVTGSALGRFEDILGHAQVKRVQPRFSEAALIPAHGAAAAPPRGRRADHARPDPGGGAAGGGPDRSQADLRRVPFMLALGLDQTKRFQSSGPRRGARAAAQPAHAAGGAARPPREGGRAQPRRSRCPGWLIPVLMERGSAMYLDVTWISGGHGHAALLPAPRPRPGRVGGGAAVPLGAARRGLACGSRLRRCWVCSCRPMKRRACIRLGLGLCVAATCSRGLRRASASSSGFRKPSDPTVEIKSAEPALAPDQEPALRRRRRASPSTSGSRRTRCRRP